MRLSEAVLERSWTEDSPNENGNYFNICCTCHHDFVGHKRRMACKTCAEFIVGVVDCPVFTAMLIDALGKPCTCGNSKTTGHHEICYQNFHNVVRAYKKRFR